jgi:hypothetical protein
VCCQGYCDGMMSPSSLLHDCKLSSTIHIGAKSNTVYLAGRAPMPGGVGAASADLSKPIGAKSHLGTVSTKVLTSGGGQTRERDIGRISKP